MPPRDPLANPEPLIRRVYAYAAYRLGEGPDAEDVTSETFERALRYRMSYDPAKGEPIAWLVGIARRCADDLAARRSDHGRPSTLEPASGNLEDEAIARMTVRAGLGLLVRRDRELIALRYGADLTARQIGAVLGVPTTTVEAGLHRALGRLRTCLDGDEAARRASKEAGSIRARPAWGVYGSEPSIPELP